MGRTDKDTRREGDKRPSDPEEKMTLTLRPAEDQPFRWLPKHGQPLCIGEWVTQNAVRAVAWAPIYTALVATLTLVVYVFGVPFMDAR